MGSSSSGSSPSPSARGSTSLSTAASCCKEATRTSRSRHRIASITMGSHAAPFFAGFFAAVAVAAAARHTKNSVARTHMYTRDANVWDSSTSFKGRFLSPLFLCPPLVLRSKLFHRCRVAVRCTGLRG
jgi:hypothetical protein